MINRVVLVGRLTKDPEVKNTNSGNTVCSFTVAVDNRSKNPDGTKSTSFIPCVVFAAAADNVAKYTRKGSLVGVEGRINQRSFQRKDGTNASVLEVLCDSVQFLEPKSADNASSADETLTFSDESTDSVEPTQVADDDLPF